MPKQHILMAGGLAMVTLTLSVLGLIELSRSEVLGRAPALLVFDTAEDGQARLGVDGAKSPSDLARAAAHARNALAQSAYNNNARLRLVYIDVVRNGALTPTGQRLLAQSYDLVPYDASIASWRVQFALEHWGYLEPTTRVSVRKEALAFGRTYSQTANIRATLNSIHDERGRVVAALWLRRLRPGVS